MAVINSNPSSMGKEPLVSFFFSSCVFLHVNVNFYVRKLGLYITLEFILGLNGVFHITYLA